VPGPCPAAAIAEVNKVCAKMPTVVLVGLVLAVGAVPTTAQVSLRERKPGR
jgi:hypothetical protein